jgi:outer membrane protein OmpA-like peptidoglycan-associated protein
LADPDDAPEESSGSGARPASAAADLDRLRRLILAEEQERLAGLEQRLDDADVRAEEISRVLPESVARASHDGNRLSLALAPAVEDALSVSITKNRKHLAEALAPAMGPAIRRAIAETLRAMVDSFNQVLQHSLSARAVRWRVEAWRTGRPFAEVVLSHSLVFRVEQVFLVHRKSGLLLQHVSADQTTSHDGDLVSGMLTAIQDFVRDSFSVGAEEAVDTMRVGNLSVLVEQGEEAYLAAVVRGAPPVSLRGVLRDSLESIHLDLGETFETFSGDTTPFEDIRHHLEGCLQMQVAGKRERRYWLAPAIVIGVALLLLAVWAVLSVRAGRRWDAYLARLDAEPGVVVVAADGGIRRSSISGLRDPYAADPVALLGEHGLATDRVASRWEPYVSQEPATVLARARAVLEAPPSAKLSLNGGILSVSGSAPHRWLKAAEPRAVTVPGVLRFDTAEVVDEGMAAMAPARHRLEGLILRFDVGAAELHRGEDATLDQAATALEELATIGGQVGIAVRVDVIGRTDGTGSEGTNVRLSRARAEWVLSALEAHGVGDLTLAILGVGASQPIRPEATAEDRAFNRSVTFRVAAE